MYTCIIKLLIMLNVIPLVLSTDNYGSKYLDVTLLSILTNADKTTFYDIYILTPKNFSKKAKLKLEFDTKSFRNNKIHFINMNNCFSNAKMLQKHITYPCLFRLKTDLVVPKTYDKCIYLDTDTIIQTDLQELFKIDIDDYYIAGVFDIGITLKRFKYIHPKYNNALNIPDLSTYINSGVLLINLKKIRMDNISKQFINESRKNYFFADQDVLNKVCYGKIKLLPPKFNSITMYNKIINKSNEFRNIYTKKEIAESIKSPKIIHYAGGHKKP